MGAPPPTEDTPLKQAKAPLSDAEASSAPSDSAAPPKEWYVEYAAALSIVFYIAVAVTKTLLTKQLLNSASTPVALSAMSCIITCITLVPVFLIKPSTWGVLDWRKNGWGFALVTLLVTLDLAFTNISVSLLSVPIQQTLLAVNPAATVIIESIVKRKLNHPVIYMTITVLIIGPIITNLGVPASKISAGGIIAQLFGVLASSCKYVFAHSVMQSCKKELGSFAFLFWLDAATLIILIPWAFIDSSMVHLFESLHTGTDVVKLLGTSFLGGLRFFSQLIVLRFTTATNLSCANIGFQAINIYLSLALFHDTQVTGFLIGGTILTLTTSSVYTYWKVSKVLTKKPMCIKFNDDFQECVACNGRAQTGPNKDSPYSKV
ncbi:hypothetical protein AB1Y20_010369 [Prymnesium parvum]|uniref:Sugar phosphate transporter domain-containing protein n=1 Tax=Prymnesium parvum TaxID=97485 RepID=A0AB34IRB6_PRYPA